MLFDQAYARALSRQPTTRAVEITTILKEVPLFGAFSQLEMLTLADMMHVRSYRKDEYLYRERDPGLGMYIVTSGRVRLLSEDEEGALHEVRQVDEYEILGELALLGDFRRMDTAQAVVETRVFGFFRPELKSMMKRDARTAAMLLNTLAEYMSGQYVNVVQSLVEKEGKIAARKLLEATRSDVSAQADGTPFIVKP